MNTTKPAYLTRVKKYVGRYAGLLLNGCVTHPANGAGCGAAGIDSTAARGCTF